jgi:hypothetical protein
MALEMPQNSPASPVSPLFKPDSATVVFYRHEGKLRVVLAIWEIPRWSRRGRCSK